jgi:hypothetical protein
MNVTFPSQVSSVSDWLTQINLAKYVPSFESAGILNVAELPLLTDERLKQAGVTMVGHRKRLLQAAKELNTQGAGSGSVLGSASAMTTSETTTGQGSAEAMDLEGPAPPTAPSQRFNSTSSIFINSTITRPDIDEVIFCVAVVIHDRIVQGEQMSPGAANLFPFFSEENNPLYLDPRERANQEQRGEGSKRTKREVPAEETIFHTLHSVYSCARFPSECLIISLVYIERLIAVAGVPILCTSWRPILLAALILAQKVWDDRSLHNVDFSMFCPMFTLKEINHLEKKFLELIEYDVSVSTSLYASYYFQLRTLCQRENNGQEPALKPMDMETAQALEARGLSKTAELKKSAGKTWQSANDVDATASVGSLASLRGPL